MVAHEVSLQGVGSAAAGAPVILERTEQDFLPAMLEKLSQEQMKLYREYGINPLGGCLPLLIQFPIFIALIGRGLFRSAKATTMAAR